MGLKSVLGFEVLFVIALFNLQKRSRFNLMLAGYFSLTQYRLNPLITYGVYNIFCYKS